MFYFMSKIWEPLNWIKVFAIWFLYELNCYSILGQKYIVSGLRRNTDCSSKRYQPFKFWSNTSSQCVFKKSKCNEIGQTFVDNDSTKKDTECRCDYKKGFGFIVKPKNTCVCIPSKEDCTCYSVPCPLNYTLTAGNSHNYENCKRDSKVFNDVFLQSQVLWNQSKVSKRRTSVWKTNIRIKGQGGHCY